uniref:UPF0725 protein n=1 Tax=Noccaea caerulescens TaxID=107243 RepID=A0A1J3F9W5_NOCCA
MVPWLSTEEGREKYMQLLIESEEFCGTSVLLGLGSDGIGIERSLTICNAPPFSPCSVLVRLYATMSLHCYNLLQGKNVELSHVLRYSKTLGSPAASEYGITMDAMDPSLGLVRTFQTSISEQSYGKLALICNVATPPHGETKKICNIGDEIQRSRHVYELHLTDRMPEMPPLNPFQNTNGCYLLKKSEVEENEWIRMYLDLAYATTLRGTTRGPDLSKLEIVEVAVSIEEESCDDTNDEGLGLCRATNAIFYIRHMYWCRAWLKKKDVDRIAIVRRIFNHRTSRLSLVGQIHSSQTSIPKPKNDENPSLVAPLNRKSSQTIRTKIGGKHSGGYDSLVRQKTQGIQKPIRRRSIGSSSAQDN